jgi:hypothetical protein
MSGPRLVHSLMLSVTVVLAASSMALAKSPAEPSSGTSPAPVEPATEYFAPLAGTEADLVVAVGPGTKVRAYACDGDTVALWWVGDATDGSFAAPSVDGGATMAVRIEGDTADGTIAFTDGTVIPFSAAPTSGAEGIYAVDLQPDGTMAGSSLGGNVFSGQFDFEGNTLAGQVVTPAGETVTIEASQAQTGGTTAPGAYLAVLDAAGQAKGFQLKVPGKPSEGFVAGWVMP